MDVHTGWAQNLAGKNRTQAAVIEQIKLMRQRLPFPLLSLDCDSGDEFNQDGLYRCCLKENFTFTHLRPYQKNDQAHVEQKNWSEARRTVGGNRYVTPDQLAWLQRVYQNLCYYVNFFRPVLMLAGKRHIQLGKYVETYDQATTQFRRVLRADGDALHLEGAWANQYSKLNVVALKNRLEVNVAVPRRLSRDHFYLRQWC